MRFDQRLVLNQYMLGLFGVASFEELAKHLKDPESEEWDEEQITQFHHILKSHYPRLPTLNPPGPSRDDLLRYDGNIVRHTLDIGHAQPNRIRWKYFQYLALLFVEIYLDRYFSDPVGLLSGLNQRVIAFNETAGPKDQLLPYAPPDLRKLALWMATGSGKTFIMHVNILQYRHYLARHGRQGDINQTILVTPNEGLTRQHLEELAKSGITAERFDKSAGQMFARSAIQVLDIHKLADDMGEKRVAVEAFESNNLVLVDEGHRGAGGEDWMKRRARLASDGFAFEYSATFGQAVKAAKKETIAQEYARCILFDYSYRHFYGDGYGKDYQILNLSEGATGETTQRYLTGSLLAFYQQQFLFDTRSAAFSPYGIEKPLWVFVGGTVAAGYSTVEGSDIISILKFIDRFVSDPTESIANLDRLMSGSTGLVAGTFDIFANKFPYLGEQDQAGSVRGSLHADVLRRFFNANHAAPLRVEELKGTEGELALRLGDYEPFGVINVGDAHRLAKVCGEHGINVTERQFSGSLFTSLSDRHSNLHLLIGSKKFTEGWNSFRVSSLGLMNVGKSEGSQIIQLFGRGVRLWGLDGSLKRSAAVPSATHPEGIGALETLNVYGLRADYMAAFKDHLAEEGLPSNEAMQQISIPVTKKLPERPLRLIRMQDGSNFKHDGERPVLQSVPQKFKDHPIPLDYYPKVQALESAGINGRKLTAEDNVESLDQRHLAVIDLDAIYFEIVRYKNDRGWHNLTIDRHAIRDLLSDGSWYVLTIPADIMDFTDPHPLRHRYVWQEVATALLMKFVDRYYKDCREAFEAPLREYYTLDASNSNFFDEYQVVVADDHARLVIELKKAAERMGRGNYQPFKHHPIETLVFSQHLYQPLVHLAEKDVTVKPVALNAGERDFVSDLEKYFDAHPGFFADNELYLLRNMTRSKGVGFFEAGNFYPDYILWLLVNDRQYITFIDPKGILRLDRRLNDPKIAFHQTIKAIEGNLGDPNMVLNSFIISNTPYVNVSSWKLTKDALEAHHVLFQHDDRTTYIQRMFDRILA